MRMKSQVRHRNFVEKLQVALFLYKRAKRQDLVKLEEVWYDNLSAVKKDTWNWLYRVSLRYEL